LQIDDCELLIERRIDKINADISNPQFAICNLQLTSGRSEAWYRVRFGSGRSLVRIQSPRPSQSDLVP
jgi:hypothetical protein